jgi:hypothetical protein
MAFSINEIRGALTYSGARNTLFSLQVTSPAYLNGSASDNKLIFTARAARIPESKVGSIQVPYFGRKVKYAGDRTFDPWTITVINDEDFQVRDNMEAWLSSINSHTGNLLSGSATQAQYKSNATVTQYAKDGGIIRVYEFNGIFPTEVNAIDLDWDATDRLEEFQVTFDYDLWTIVDGNTGDAGTNSTYV